MELGKYEVVKVSDEGAGVSDKVVKVGKI